MATRLFRALFVAVAVGALPLLAGCDIRVNEGGGLSLGVSRGRASDEWTRTYTVGKAGRFEIANENGAIEVRGTTGPQITVKAFREVTARSDEEARERLQKLEMREEVAPDRVSVRAETNEPGAFGFNRGVSVRYEVELPPGLTVAFKTQNGAVRLNDLEGKITAGVTNGTVTGREVSGSVLATSVNGSVQMDLAAVSGDVRLTTVNGAVRLEIPSTLDVDLDATTVNGGVSVDERLGLANVSSNRGGFGPTTNISGRLNKGGPHVTLQTTNGGIRVAPRGSGDADEEPGRPGRRGRRGPTPAEF
ncbi:MAG TPA: DUF4097 family beta strand repeat-containing protein [Vicinamibacterales bacterium]|jgi:hypothetical protein|nr:DUF4097 family beta strand repeat-containing protein [Vicinamibacterales bacterium]